MYHNHTLWWIIWITIVVLLLIFFEPRRKKKKATDNNSPLEILQRRFASGEITKEEYEEKKEILEKDDFSKPKN